MMKKATNKMTKIRQTTKMSHKTTIKAFRVSMLSLIFIQNETKNYKNETENRKETKLLEREKHETKKTNRMRRKTTQKSFKIETLNLFF